MTGVLAAAALAFPAAAQASGSTLPECGNGDLKASFRATDAGMSHVFGRLVVRNVSGRACTVQGYGGLSYVGHGNGTQIGAAAARDASRRPRVVLTPGQRAVSPVSMTTTGPYPAGVCRTVWADGFRVYVPDSTVSQYVAHRVQVCSNPSLVTLTHKAFRHA